MANIKHLAFDIGANNGDATAELLNHYEKVVCFEPTPSLELHLQERFKNTNVEVVKKGLAKTEGIKTFYISNTWGGVLSTLAEDWKTKSRFVDIGNWHEQITIETTTLDQIIKQYGIPNFVKVDVEGYEYEVIQGLTKLLDNTLFGFEWTEELFLDAENIVKYVQALGYKQFSYTYEDKLHNIDTLVFKNWQELDIHINISQQRKTLWGMIYFKK
jgi:FkbM family methyltransferase